MKYRPEIDGLRAFAVLSVVLYHSNLDIAPGGYVGVDIFFVISGYLITKIIWSEVQNGTFTLAKFYERRARRIIPALALVSVICFAVCLFLFLKTDFQDFSKSLLASISFVSNIFFWSEIDYFAAPAQTMPLLHTWSLSVEEQFYLTYPLILLGSFKFWKGDVRPVLILLTIGSFLFAVWHVSRDPGSAFFLFHARAWELLLGALLATSVFPRIRNNRLSEYVGAIGMALMLSAVIVFDHATKFPGVSALIPCVGAFLFIWSNECRLNIIGRVLSTRKLVLIGKLSYSLYLWHWPLFVFAQYITLQPLSIGQAIVVVALSFVCAGLSWQYVEKPFRNGHSHLSSGLVLRKSASALALIAIFAFAGLSLTEHYKRPMDRLLVASDKEEISKCVRSQKIKPIEHGWLCSLGELNGEAEFLIWGDSHSKVLYPMLNRLADDLSKAGALAFSVACPPLLEVERINRSLHCRKFNSAVAQFLKNSEIRTVILAARWEWAVGRPDHELEMGQAQVLFGDKQTVEFTVDENLRVYARGLERTLQFLNELGIETYILMQVPYVGVRVPQLLAVRPGLRNQTEVRLPLEDSLQRSYVVNATLDEIALRNRAYLLDPVDTLCEQNTCLIAKNGQNLYRDDDHLSPIGSNLLREIIEDAVTQKSKPDAET